MEYFKGLGSLITNDVRCKREIKSRIAMGKATFNNKINHFTSKLSLIFRNKLVKNCIRNIIGHFGKWTRNTINFLSVVLEKDDQLDPSCEK